MSKAIKYTIYNLGNDCVINFPKSLEGMGHWNDCYSKERKRKNSKFLEKKPKGKIDMKTLKINLYDSCELINYCNNEKIDGNHLLDLANNTLIKIVHNELTTKTRIKNIKNFPESFFISNGKYYE